MSRVWSYELKFEGYRAIGIEANGRIRLLSRNGKDFTGGLRLLRGNWKYGKAAFSTRVGFGDAQVERWQHGVMEYIERELAKEHDKNLCANVKCTAGEDGKSMCPVDFNQTRRYLCPTLRKSPVTSHHTDQLTLN